MTRRLLLKHAAPVAPFAPTDLTGLELWLKADAIALADGAAVATWPDSSGLGRDATQATSGNRPTFETNELNSLPVVRFVNTSSHYLLANAAAVAFSGDDKATTVFGVCKTDLTVQYTTWLGVANNVGFVQHYQYRITTDNSGRYEYIKRGDSGGAVLVGSANASATNAWHIHSVVQPGTTVSSWVDGAASIVAGAQNVVAATLDRVTVGGMFYGGALENGVRFKGDIAEILVYSRALSDAERDQVEAHLGTKWGITVA